MPKWKSAVVQFASIRINNLTPRRTFPAKMLTQILKKDFRNDNEVDCEQEKKNPNINRKSLRTQDVLNIFFTYILQTRTVGCFEFWVVFFWFWGFCFGFFICLVGFVKRTGL